MTTPAPASHFGSTPSAVADAILSALSCLTKSGATGCLRTLKRMAGDRLDLDVVDSLLTAGLPAMLVAFMGGTFEPYGTDGQGYLQRMRFSVVCAAGRFSSMADRLAGTTPAVDPGVDDLLDWAMYYACRGAAATSGVSRVKPTATRWLRIEPGKYVGALELEGTRIVDIYDDAVETTLLSLGLVHNPLDYKQLFDEIDNVTPQTNEPETAKGGVVIL